MGVLTIIDVVVYDLDFAGTFIIILCESGRQLFKLCWSMIIILP
jgi:hypothetical protein